MSFGPNPADLGKRKSHLQTSVALENKVYLRQCRFFCLSILRRRPAGSLGLRPDRGQDLRGLGPHRGIGAPISGAQPLGAGN